MTPRDACPSCYQTFHDSLKERQARGLDVCLGCAVDQNLPLHPDDADDLAEDYWTKRYAARLEYCE